MATLFRTELSTVASSLFFGFGTRGLFLGGVSSTISPSSCSTDRSFSSSGTRVVLEADGETTLILGGTEFHLRFADTNFGFATLWLGRRCCRISRVGIAAICTLPPPPGASREMCVMPSYVHAVEISLFFRACLAS